MSVKNKLFQITDVLRDNPNSVTQERVVQQILTMHDEGSHTPEKVMYAASLVADELIIREVGEGVYRRIGHHGLSNTKLEAAEALKRNIIAKFTNDLKCVDWQSQQFIKPM